MNAPSPMSSISTMPLHVGATILDQLPRLMRESGVGRTVVVHDASATENAATELVETALGGMRALLVEVDTDVAGTDVYLVLNALHRLDGGVVVTVGNAQTVSLGKRAAALANNGDLAAQSDGQPLPRAPLPHIAVPTAAWPPEEVTDLVQVVPGMPLSTGSGFVRDARLAPLAVIDGRLHSDHRLIPRSAVGQALAIAACAARDPRGAFDDRARALAAAHVLAATQHDNRPEPLELRAAMSLAAASHRDYLICDRCAGGTLLHRGDPPVSPAEFCLARALEPD